MSRVVDASRAILVELKRVLRREESELYWAESAELGEKEKSRRLWHLFPIPGLGGDIFAAKSARDAVPRRGRCLCAWRYSSTWSSPSPTHSCSLMSCCSRFNRPPLKRLVSNFHALVHDGSIGYVHGCCADSALLDSIHHSRGCAEIGGENVAHFLQLHCSCDEWKLHWCNRLQCSGVSIRVSKNRKASSQQCDWDSRRQIIQICGGDDNSNRYRKGISNALGNFLGTFDYGLGGILQLPRGIQDGLVHTASSVNSGLLRAIVQLLSSIGVLATVLVLYIYPFPT